MKHTAINIKIRSIWSAKRNYNKINQCIFYLNINYYLENTNWYIVVTVLSIIILFFIFIVGVFITKTSSPIGKTMKTNDKFSLFFFKMIYSFLSYVPVEIRLLFLLSSSSSSRDNLLDFFNKGCLSLILGFSWISLWKKSNTNVYTH